MKPVLQTIFGVSGNCLQAAVASLLELRLDQVPHFYQLSAGEAESEMARLRRGEEGDVQLVWRGHRAFLRWFEGFGILARERVLGDHEGGWCFPHLMVGKSGRGFQHAVIYDSGELVHDPHPDGGGIARPFRAIDLLVTDPTKLHLLEGLRRR